MGAVVNSSLVSVVCRLVLFTSTTGDSPATVTVSVTATHPQFGVDRRRERAGQLDAVALGAR